MRTLREDEVDCFLSLAGRRGEGWGRGGGRGRVHSRGRRGILARGRGAGDAEGRGVDDWIEGESHGDGILQQRRLLLLQRLFHRVVFGDEKLCLPLHVGDEVPIALNVELELLDIVCLALSMLDLRLSNLGPSKLCFIELLSW